MVKKIKTILKWHIYVLVGTVVVAFLIGFIGQLAVNAVLALQ